MLRCCLDEVSTGLLLVMYVPIPGVLLGYANYFLFSTTLGSTKQRSRVARGLF
jgi:hypothetical protein